MACSMYFRFKSKPSWLIAASRASLSLKWRYGAARLTPAPLANSLRESVSTGLDSQVLYCGRNQRRSQVTVVVSHRPAFSLISLNFL
jgi:hypothetical protein